ncbi:MULTISPECIES: YiaA/YiaB family inner membrane protein [unclassified Frigidibacter]|uniref:YiaA/YiaB family inner membrane protein n=1 Tax=unclassified Frigidibacter TaxID=2641805 RepID=UPI00226F91C2|nr:MULTISPECIES: YiaA/YiaB family inner membrane protein [unclassified Frigidibacter]MCY1126870.1 YiaA/YiaB family inner membrane protein [Frigidibacter sp. RF13]
MQDAAYQRVYSNTFAIFTIFNFVVAAAMMAGGIYNMDATFAGKGFYAMSALMLVSSAIAITNTLRDREEAQRLHNKIEEARTEKLLMEVNTSKNI